MTEKKKEPTKEEIIDMKLNAIGNLSAQTSDNIKLLYNVLRHLFNKVDETGVSEWDRASKRHEVEIKNLFEKKKTEELNKKKKTE